MPQRVLFAEPAVGLRLTDAVMVKLSAGLPLPIHVPEVFASSDRQRRS